MNLSYNASWAIYSTDDIIAPEVDDQEKDFSYSAYCHSGLTYHSEEQDSKILR